MSLDTLKEDKFLNIPFCEYSEMTEEDFEFHLKFSVRHNVSRYDTLLEELKKMAFIYDIPVPDRFVRFYFDIRTETKGFFKKTDVKIVIPKLYLQIKTMELTADEQRAWTLILLGVLKGMKF